MASRNDLIDQDYPRVLHYMRTTNTKAVAIDYGEEGVCFYVDLEREGSGKYNLRFFWGTKESLWKHPNAACPNVDDPNWNPTTEMVLKGEGA